MKTYETLVAEYERLKDILIGYIDNDLESADIEYVRDTLTNLCTVKELKDLGLWTWLGFQE